MINKIQTKLYFLSLSIFIILIDQFTKYLMFYKHKIFINKDLLISNFDAKEKIFLSKKSVSLSRFMNWFSPLGKDKPLINRANGSPDIFSKFMNRISN